MKILAGLQTSKHVENPLPKIIESEQHQYLVEKQRLENEQKTVFGHFNIFEKKLLRYEEMLKNINVLFEEKNKKYFLSTLTESKNKLLQTFGDIVINDDIDVAMKYMFENYYSLKDEIEKIVKVNEKINETDAPTYFVSQPLITHDSMHNVVISVFKHQTLQEKISNEIPYGAEIVYISESLTLVKHSGKKFYCRLSKDNINLLEKKGFLI